ncbi:putative membrane protein YfcA [Bradyrhizobium sp. i1.8.4]|uniref:sulfite exporter TauE/SafE family protein n=1 Tax=unclassified Bradyrhizobium TaxID=2631580 RepID=UPI003D1E7E08
MADVTSFLVLSAAVFCGAFVSGLAGFAFSAIAGAILLHAMPPTEAVPLMMACSVGVQAANLWALRHNIQWKQSLSLIVGGLLGVPLALWLLHNADSRTFREGFGIMVALYAGYMLFRPAIGYGRLPEGRNALVGFGGGLIGGLTAMPGALPTIWCDIHGVPKQQQRGLVQPFIAAMQISALAMMLLHRDLSMKVAYDVVLSAPALLAGSWLGIFAFRNINEANFRRVILGLLLVSGLLLVI